MIDECDSLTSADSWQLSTWGWQLSLVKQWLVTAVPAPPCQNEWQLTDRWSIPGEIWYKRNIIKSDSFSCKKDMTGGGKRAISLSQYKEKKRFSPISPRFNQSFNNSHKSTKISKQDEVNTTTESNYGEYFPSLLVILVFRPSFFVWNLQKD